MKNVFIKDIALAIFCNVLIVLGFCVFGIVTIFTFDSSFSIVTFFQIALTIAPVLFYIKCWDVGAFDKIQIDDAGITIKRGRKKQIAFVPWDKVLSIKEVFEIYGRMIVINSNVIINGNRFFIVIRKRKRIENLIKEYYDF